MSVRHLVKPLFFFQLIIIFSSACFASDYSITDAGRTYNCSKFQVAEEKLYCTHDKAMYVYMKGTVEKISYKGIDIYPYIYNEKNIFNSIKTGDCNKIVRLLYGPLIIDKLDKANMFLGAMYDRGVCAPQDYNKALFFYEKSNLSSTHFLNTRVKEIKDMFAFEKKQEAERQQALKEKEAERQRALVVERETRRKQEEEARKDEEQQKLADAAVQEYERLQDQAAEQQRLEEERIAKLLEKQEQDRIEKEKQIAAEKARYEENHRIEAEVRNLQAELYAWESQAMQYRKKCSKDCSTNKYQYNTSCFNACIEHHAGPKPLAVKCVDRAKKIENDCLNLCAQESIFIDGRRQKATKALRQYCENGCEIQYREEFIDCR